MSSSASDATATATATATGGDTDGSVSLRAWLASLVAHARREAPAAAADYAMAGGATAATPLLVDGASGLVLLSDAQAATAVVATAPVVVAALAATAAATAVGSFDSLEAARAGRGGGRGTSSVQ